jgi:hypothetical protein
MGMEKQQQKPKLAEIDFESLRLIAESDQYANEIRNVAMIVANYYKALVDEGVPEDLAGEIVRDWHLEFWDAVYGME